MLATEPKKQILIVDRDVAAVEPLRQRLSDAGFAVRAMTDGAAAVNAVNERPPHLVIVDWNMPGIAALELIQGVRRARMPQAVRLIILSALSGEQDVVTGLNLGADDYIAKPYSLREVIARVSAVLRVHAHEETAAGRCAAMTWCSMRRPTGSRPAAPAQPARRRVPAARVPDVACRAHLQSQSAARARVGRR